MVGRCSILTSQPKDSSMEAHPVWGFWRSFSSMSLGTNSLLFTYHDNWQLDKALIAYLSIFCTLQDQYLISTDHDEDDSLDSSSSIIFTWQSPPPKVKSEAALDICCIFSEIASISNSLLLIWYSILKVLLLITMMIVQHSKTCLTFNKAHAPKKIRKSKGKNIICLWIIVDLQSDYLALWACTWVIVIFCGLIVIVIIANYDVMIVMTPNKMVFSHLSRIPIR